MFNNPESAFGNTSFLLETIDTIYSAVQDPTLWNTALARVASALKGESIALFATTPDLSAPNIVALANVTPEVWKNFADYYAGINPLMARVKQVYPGSETVFSQALITDSDLEHTEFYADFYRPNRMHHTVGMLLNAGDIAAAFTCQRPRSAGPFGADADVVCQTLKPHLLRAFQLHRQMGILQASTLGLNAALAAHGHAVLGLDTSLEIVLCNNSAGMILAKGDSIRVVNNRLRCRDAQDEQALQQILTGAVNLGTSGTGGAVTVRGANCPSLAVAVSPFRFSVPGYSSPIAALVFLADPSAVPRTRAEIMRAVYGLTPAEARIADRLLVGLDVSEISEQLAVSPDTVRYHLKQIFAKTGTRRQAELVRRMLALPAM